MLLDILLKGQSRTDYFHSVGPNGVELVCFFPGRRSSVET